ncbi:hypothetical protein [Ottowia sp.]|uniref:hypothetical protein n=1 Tax=Ottowia sp. TaxID=1898956 RepID=UPI003A8466E7
MNDAVWGFLSAVAGSLIGGVIAWRVAMVATRAQVAAALEATSLQINASRDMERRKQERDLALKLLIEIDEFVHVSFRGSKEDRQLAGRTMLTTALTVLKVDDVKAFNEQLTRIDRYHQVRAADKSIAGLTNYSQVENFFVSRNTVFAKTF